MRIILVVVGFALFLAGCSTGNLVKRVPDLSHKDFVSVTDELAKNAIDHSKEFACCHLVAPLAGTGFIPNEKVDKVFNESPSLRYWHYRFESVSYAYQINDSVNSLMDVYGDYCSAKDGKLSGVTYKKTCRKSSDNTVMFFVSLYIYDNGPADNGRLNVRGEHSGVEKVAIVIDGFEWKNPSQSSDISSEYLPVGETYAPTANALAMKEQALKAAEENRKNAQQRWSAAARDLEIKQADLREQKIRDLPKVKTIGQKICKTIDGMHKNILGYAMGKPIFGPERQVKYYLTAFTENVSGSKIQVRISGMQLNSENINRVDGDTVLQNGSIIWDEALEWNLCQVQQ
jgi:hypothetical protein